MRIDDKVLCERFNIPLLENSYQTPRGAVYGFWRDGHQVNLMQVWDMYRQPHRHHPLRWLNSLRVKPFITGLMDMYPEGSENAEGVPIYLSLDYENDELFALLRDFERNPKMDDERWLSYGQVLHVNPFLAHLYIQRISPTATHNYIAADPDNAKTYKGYYFRSNRNATYPLWDVLSGLSDSLNLEGDPLLARARQIRHSTISDSVKLHDIWLYGRPELNHLGISYLPTHLLINDIPLYLGLRSGTPIRFDKDLAAYHFDVMAPAWQRTFYTRRGRNPPLHVTWEMCKFIVDQLLFEGLIKIKNDHLSN